MEARVSWENQHLCQKKLASIKILLNSYLLFDTQNLTPDWRRKMTTVCNIFIISEQMRTWKYFSQIFRGPNLNLPALLVKNKCTNEISKQLMFIQWCYGPKYLKIQNLMRTLKNFFYIVTWMEICLTGTHIFLFIRYTDRWQLIFCLKQIVICYFCLFSYIIRYNQNGHISCGQ